MPKKQPDYRVISKPPEGYQLPDCWYEAMVKAATREVEAKQKAGQQ